MSASSALILAAATCYILAYLLGLKEGIPSALAYAYVFLGIANIFFSQL